MANQEPTFYLLKRRLPSNETPLMLGRIVRQFQDPTASYVPEDPSLIFAGLQSHILETQDRDVELLSRASRDSELAAKLKGLLSLNSSLSRQSETRVESSLVITRRLKNLDTVWAALKGDTAVATRVQEMIKSKGKAFMVTGVMVIQSGSIQRLGARQSEQGASAHIPVGAAAAASGVPIRADINAEVSVSHGSELDWSMKGNVGQDGTDNSEEIFAVEYKVLKRGWLGKDVKLQSKVPDFKGGSTYADDDDDDDESDDDKPKTQMSSSDAVGVVDEDFFSGATFAGQRPRFSQSGFVYYP
ncbi:uncharacterized protein CTRU02_202993 [Colletotrichum truncatum]|uniref:Uncharacterized protein n=1 Tax=Colletotrichum truncatum TaxID=5467 RepID=A0ACC3Z882_COLTU|nr:uncharacterized protein CTRU02_13186 [Colletotrichum truncatum]KAF6783678.1 hypothetical protein CTRU02_13186 [Colletotrichum truncatum]